MPTSKPILTTTWRVFIALLVLGLGSSCKMHQPASASFASVSISGKTPDEIRAVTTATFAEASYQAMNGSGDLVFEREGSK